MHAKPTHERRQHAMQLAGSITGFAVLVWVTTLGVRYALTPEQLAQNNADTSQVASVVEATNGNATLLVATSTNSVAQQPTGAFQ